MLQNLQGVYKSQEKFRTSISLTSRLQFTIYPNLSVRERTEIIATENGVLVIK
jgi:hypothetical protein